MRIIRLTPIVGQCGWGWPFMGMGWGMWVWILIIIVVGYLFYMSYRPRNPRTRTDKTIEVARLRLARGEITAQEFEDIKKSLQK